MLLCSGQVTDVRVDTVSQILSDPLEGYIEAAMTMRHDKQRTSL